MAGTTKRVVIVDYNMGNLFSVSHACEHAGLSTLITSSSKEIDSADALILPGVGAFGDAMENLGKLDLVSPIRSFAETGRPLLGICLGMQLLMESSCEFGSHAGLGIIPGSVVRFEFPPGGRLKVPQAQWNRMFRIDRGADDPWSKTLLDGLPDGFFMYFVHSFYVVPEHPAHALAATQYGEITFCSALKRGNVMAFQGHPERSAFHGMQIYHNLGKILSGSLKQEY